jgi:glycosyltransferase involved in cell wall biosynthesis
VYYNRNQSLSALIQTPISLAKVFYYIFKADIIHWTFGYRPERYYPLLWWIKFLKKPAVVEFCGTDIRYIEDKNSPFFEELKPFVGSKEASLKAQSIFAKNGFSAMTFGYELEDYIDKRLFPTLYKTNRRLNLDQFKPKYKTGHARPIVLHAPSKSGVKGTKYVLDAVAKLRIEGYDFDFKLLENMHHDKIIKYIRNSDIVIDQLLLGDHGTLSLEAMALGKPVLCYLKDSVAKNLPKDCPILNVDIETISEHLKDLLSNSDKGINIGMEGRRYVEKYHCAYKITEELVVIYNSIIADKNNKNVLKNR